MITAEDKLKLNVLIASSIAIRIDTYKLEVVGLNAKNQQQIIRLNPTTDSTTYLKLVQKLLVQKVLGSMGGYPSYLKHWSRMGQVSASNLSALLKLGDVEAVVAVANSHNLDVDLLDLTWWCATNTDQQAEIGRFLLSKDFVINHAIATDIAGFLLEFLPYIEEPQVLIDTISLILQGNLIDDNTKLKLWKMGERKTAFLVGFLEQMPDNLPNTDNIKALNCKDKFCQVEGQIFLKTAAHILQKINQEQVLYRTLEALGKFFADPKISKFNTIEALQSAAKKIAKNDETTKAKLLLAGVSERLAVSTISAHNLTGSAIRKKLSHILTPIQSAIQTLTKTNI